MTGFIDNILHRMGLSGPTAVQKSEEQLEQETIAAFKYNIDVHRQYDVHRYKRAPEYDYLNWREKGFRRTKPKHPRSHLFPMQAKAIAPWVLDTTTTSHQYFEENRWRAMTIMPEGGYLGSRVASRGNLYGSRPQGIETQNPAYQPDISINQ